MQPVTSFLKRDLFLTPHVLLLPPLMKIYPDSCWDTQYFGLKIYQKMQKNTQKKWFSLVHAPRQPHPHLGGNNIPSEKQCRIKRRFSLSLPKQECGLHCVTARWWRLDYCCLLVPASNNKPAFCGTFLSHALVDAVLLLLLLLFLFFFVFFHAEQMAGETKSQTCCSCWKVKLRCKQPTHAHIGFGDAAKSSNCDKLWSASLKKKKTLAWSFCCSCLTCWIVVLPFSVLPSVMLQSSRKLTNCLGYGPKNRKTAVSNRNGRLPVSFRHWGSCDFFVGLLMIDKVRCQDMTMSSWTIITVFWQVVKCHPHANKLFFFTLNANLIQIWQNLFWSWRGMAESARG